MIKNVRMLMEAATSPWAMEPTKLAAMVSIFRFAALGGKLSAAEIDCRLEAAKMHPATDKSIAGKQGAIAVVGLRGVISNRAPLVDDVSSGGGTNMEQFGAAFRAARDSDDIKAIILDTHTPGGCVYGVPEMAEEIFNSRDAKPIIAQVNALCASAGYWLAAACTEIVITASGEIGSIGVYTIHEDVSKMYEEAGVKETLISAGKYKVEGNPFEPLGEDARAAIQMSVDGYYTMFVDAVARYRGVTSQAVRDGFGQGRVARAPDSIGIGLSDRLGTMADTLQRFGIRPGAASKSAMRAEGEAPEPQSEVPASTPRLNIARRKLELDALN